ncbi:MAG TPA: DUF1353 domain-containing protein [Smithellaceae bacterium]|nr:DUF1353 domain-containing protein [Smithellaceae bacterium]
MDSSATVSASGLIYGFQNTLVSMEIGMAGSTTIHKVHEPLYYIDEQGRLWFIPIGFETDLASIPRIPVVWFLWGDRVHREGVLHDFAYRKDSYYFVRNASGVWIKVDKQISRSEADDLLFEAIRSESPCHKGEPFWVSYPVWAGVRVGGWGAYHNMMVEDKYKLDHSYQTLKESKVTVCNK